ncbi:MAG TPA: NADH-quinone oxidoreductase subunit J [Planctomycetaceae bacterium]|nr:NADH-quinone oxidoreductase subunit J [Planctomycetaceae bacterium]
MVLFDPIPAVVSGASPLSQLLDSLEMALAQPHAGSILRALVVLVVGAAGVYLMLPRGQPAGRRLERYLGAALATAALVLLATMPLQSGSASIAQSQSTFLWALESKSTCYAFHLLAFVSLASALLMVTSRNPVYSALWFALVLLGNSGLYLLQKAEFLAAATVIIYTGAIVVTFLFVIMLAQPRGTARSDRYSREPLLASATGLVLASVLLGTLHYAGRYESWGHGTAGTMRPPAQLIEASAAASGAFREIGGGNREHVSGLGKTLFVDHVAAVETIGILLLAAVVGAVLIAGHKVEGSFVSPKGNPAFQRPDHDHNRRN